jgi:hypothetical protein
LEVQTTYCLQFGEPWPLLNITPRSNKKPSLLELHFCDLDENILKAKCESLGSIKVKVQVFGLVALKLFEEKPCT